MPRRFSDPHEEPELVRWSDFPELAVAFGIALLVGLISGCVWIAWKLFELHVLPRIAP
jgi:hypothetical protein